LGNEKKSEQNLPSWSRLAADDRTLIAHTAAQLIADSGFTHYGKAKRKALSRLGASAHAMLPTDEQVEAALAQHFEGDANHAELIYEMRICALEFMRQIPSLQTQLVGAVANGIATEHFPISLECFVDDEKSVNFTLLNLGIDPEAVEVNAHQIKTMCFKFEFNDWPFELTVLPTDTKIHHASNGSALKARWTGAQLLALLKT
jgi:hypothetical protein